MDLPVDPQAIKIGFDLVKGAIDTVKSLREVFKSEPAKHTEIGAKLELAQKQVQLAEAQLAQTLGYRLCRAHFPPLPMLKNRVDGDYVEEIYKCPECGLEDPSPEHFLRKQRQSAFTRERRASSQSLDWMDRRR